MEPADLNRMRINHKVYRTDLSRKGNVLKSYQNYLDILANVL